MPQSHHHPLLNYLSIFALALGILWFGAPFSAQDNAESTPESQSEISVDVEVQHEAEASIIESAYASVAACPNVPYGTPETAAPIFASDDFANFVTPPNPNGAVIVDIGVFTEAVTDIDPVTSTFQMEGFVDLIWCDPRLNFDANELGWHEKFFLEENAAEELNAIWQPDITFPNQSGARETENLELIIFEDGTIEYKERFNVTLETHYDLRLFPFDTEILEVHIESLAWSTDFLVFHKNDNIDGVDDTFEIPEWDTLDSHARIQEATEIRSSVPFSEFYMEIEVQRRAGFYLWRVLLPMIVIVALSWSVFWMEENDLGNRLMVSFTGILTVVAYQFIISDQLPRISYITWMDAVVTFSFLMMAATIVENILVFFLATSNRKDTADAIATISRITFPIVYFIGLVVIAYVFGIFSL